MNQLADSLTKRGAEPVLRHSEGGAVLVSMTVDGRNELEARSTAQNVLREAAGAVWSALGLPPFTITLVEAKPKR